MKSSLTEVAREIRGETPLAKHKTSGASNLDESVKLFMQKQRRIKRGLNN
jgi:hypothetical protein